MLLWPTRSSHPYLALVFIQHTFVAPSLLKIKMVASTSSAVEYGHGEAGGLYIYTTPLAPGLTRIIVRRTVPFDAPSPPLLALLSSLVVPTHLKLSDIFDGDIVIMYEQERARASGETWSRAYFLATAEDVGVAATHRWLEEFGGPFPGSSLPPRAASRARLLDRWDSHAMHCPTCRRAGQAASAATKALHAVAGTGTAIAAGAAAAGVASSEAAAAAPLALGAATLALAALTGAAATSGLRASLIFQDYVHAKR